MPLPIKIKPSYEVIEGITHVIHEGRTVGYIQVPIGSSNPSDWHITFHVIYNDKPRTMLVKGSFKTEESARSFLDKAFHTIQRRFTFRG